MKLCALVVVVSARHRHTRRMRPANKLLGLQRALARASLLAPNTITHCGVPGSRMRTSRTSMPPDAARWSPHLPPAAA